MWGVLFLISNILRSLVRWFVGSLVRSFVGWLVGSFVRSFVGSLVRSSVRPFVRSNVSLFGCVFADALLLQIVEAISASIR